MIAESTPQFDVIETHGKTLTQVFSAAGAELVAPSIIQPAGLFLDVVGESLRGRTYVFTDPDGLELCLRPDLTVPACRIYLERDPAATSVQRFCYSGPVFRYQPQDAPKTNARETRQAGFEVFGVADRAAADVEVLSVTVAALHKAGLARFDVRIGDIGLLHAILEAQAMPARWRRRLAHLFWIAAGTSSERARAFHDELQRLMSRPAASARGLDADLLSRLDPATPAAAEAHVADYLAANDIDVFGTRRLSEITAGLLDAAADLRSEPLAADQAALIEGYLAIRDTPRRAVDALEALARRSGCAIDGAIAAFRHRLDLIAAAGIDVDAALFSAEFGRQFEYYTGFVFELVAPALGTKSPVAGGGRYDGLLRAVGAPRDVPAVGAAVYTERLRAALVDTPNGRAR